MHKKHNIILLPIDEGQERIFTIAKNSIGKLSYHILETNQTNDIEYYHMYITSDDMIIEGDMVVDALLNKCFKADKKDLARLNKYSQEEFGSFVKKMIATSNLNIKSPYIPNSWMLMHCISPKDYCFVEYKFYNKMVLDEFNNIVIKREI